MEERNWAEEFMKSINKEMTDMGHANLIIAGKTGVGKSTLINAAFREDIAKTGIGTPVTDDGGVRWYEKKDFPLRIYDTIGLELDEERRKHSMEQIKNVCRDAKKSNDPDRYIHAMWYCVSSDNDRLEKYEAEFINSISEEVDVVLVVTKSYRKKHSKRLVDAIERDYPGLKVKNMVIVLAQDEDPEDCDEDETPKKAYGVDTLVNITYEILPESAQKAWCNAQKASVELKCSKAQALIVATAAASFGEGYIPVPFADAVALVPTQIAMMAGITTIFGVSASEDLLKSIATALCGTAGATFGGRAIVAGLFKLIPGVGTALGGTICGATAAILTTALGEAYTAIMVMIFRGEINANELGAQTVQDRIKNVFKAKLKEKRL